MPGVARDGLGLVVMTMVRDEARAQLRAQAGCRHAAWGRCCAAGRHGRTGRRAGMAGRGYGRCRSMVLLMSRIMGQVSSDEAMNCSSQARLCGA